MGLSSAALIAACLMLCGVSVRVAKVAIPHRPLKLFVCITFLPLAVSLAILSALQLHWISSEIELP